MNNSIAPLLFFYGVFLILCGLAAIAFIGKKAKTAILSGGSAGLMAILISYMASQELYAAPFAGLFLSLALFCVFCWRSTKTLFAIFELLPSQHPDLKGKGIAFLIISLMAVISLFTFVLQWLSWYSNF